MALEIQNIQDKVSLQFGGDVFDFKMQKDIFSFEINANALHKVIQFLKEDEELNFHPSPDGWDNKWVSYGALFTVNNITYMVYNGNEMGKDGFGIAKLINQ